ncbi:MAG TPA: N-acetylmuramic acid 6-phosphate etherase [Bacteroidota bacterium]|nr:N-acetylmuramic acid 6-phosphate etherase [Bacteroidota bacterium]
MKKPPRPSGSLFLQLGKLTTEKRNPRSRNIDRLGVESVLRIINSEDARVAAAVRKEIPRIAAAVRVISASLKKGGRLLYIGAGTSGRLGVLDAAECPPTFGTSPSMIRGIIAGGRGAVFLSREGAEDRMGDGRKAMRAAGAGAGDVVCGIAASLRTPFVGAALGAAKKAGARTVLITTNPRSLLRRKEFAPLKRSADIVISPDVGPEVVMGSTRMKSGTAQKMVLNMLTTAAMVSMGKVYGNMMVDLRLNSRKLAERARRVLMISTGVDYETASKKLSAAGGHVKTAVVMIRTGTGPAAARGLLDAAGGFVHVAIAAGRPHGGHRKRHKKRTS